MPNQTPSLKQLAAIQALMGAALAGIVAAVSSPQLVASIGIGAALMFGNVLALGWSWQRLMSKKSIAWTVVIIVIKYAVLLGSIVFFARTTWFVPLGAGIGIASFMFAALVLAAIYHKKETE